jgi:hypothetical protein
MRSVATRLDHEALRTALGAPAPRGLVGGHGGTGRWGPGPCGRGGRAMAGGAAIPAAMSNVGRPCPALRSPGPRSRPRCPARSGAGPRWRADYQMGSRSPLAYPDLPTGVTCESGGGWAGDRERAALRLGHGAHLARPTLPRRRRLFRRNRGGRVPLAGGRGSAGPSPPPSPDSPALCGTLTSGLPSAERTAHIDRGGH